MSEKELRNKLEMFNSATAPALPEGPTKLELVLSSLALAKDRLGMRKLTAAEIVLVATEVWEFEIRPDSVSSALNRTGDKVHRHHEGAIVSYEIMKAGREFLASHTQEGRIDVFYCEPGSKYSTKRLLADEILPSLSGDLKIVDAYCGDRTLDMLAQVPGKGIEFLTRLANINAKDRDRFIRGFRDFKSEHPAVEIRDYPGTDIHDRYIISADKVVLIGHSIKDLGGKETFLIVLDAKNLDLHHILIQSFANKWSNSKPL